LAGETLSDPFWGKEFNRYRELDIMEVFSGMHCYKKVKTTFWLAWVRYLKKLIFLPGFAGRNLT
jgi:hypothetical protein